MRGLCGLSPFNVPMPPAQRDANMAVPLPVGEPASWTDIDRLEVAMAQRPPADLPTHHVFTKAAPGGGLYTRVIYMPAGSRLTSKIHKTEHPFFILQGRVTVFDDDNGTLELCAPHVGVTKPGTRRVIVVHEDTVWATCHPTEETDLDKIEEQIIERRVDHLPPALVRNSRGQVPDPQLEAQPQGAQ